jgi:oligosaccharide repeat unit polymerase
MGKARTLSVISIAFATILMALLGYRTQVLITLVASLLVAIIWDLITVSELLVTGSAIVAIFAFMTVMRTYTTGANVGLLESISLRAGLTLDIYDMMANLGGYLGFTKGQTLIASISSFATLMPGIAYSPRRYVAVFAGGGGISMTSTIFGPFALDFGLVGVLLIMAVFGFFIQKEHDLLKGTKGRRRCMIAFIYSMTLGYMLIGIETGLVDYEVLMLFAISFLYSLYISQFATEPQLAQH